MLRLVAKKNAAISVLRSENAQLSGLANLEAILEAFQTSPAPDAHNGLSAPSAKRRGK